MVDNESVCAPNKSEFDISCYNINTLKKIVELYNNQNTKKIDISGSETKQEIYDKIIDRLNCEGDVCVLNKLGENPEFKDIINVMEKNLKPKKPNSWIEEPNKWTSTSNIDDVMNQYDLAYPEFTFLGTVPIDFDDKLTGADICVSEDLCKIDLNKLWNNGTRMIGVVFNLDPHYKSGSHWVSLFINLRNCGIYYFDSTGTFPPKRVLDLIERIKKQGDTLLQNNKKFKMYSKEKIHDIKGNHEFRAFFNDTQHQKKNTECGVYSIFFLTEMIKGKSFIDFVDNVYEDDYIAKLRDVFWRS